MDRYRHEFKYQISKAEECILMLRASGVAMRDSHADAGGSYTIRSLYFDDASDSCLQENLAGTDPRSKFRIRYYNRDAGKLRLEKKSKTRMMTLKKSCSITEAECLCLMDGRIPEITPEMPPRKQQLFLEMLLRDLKPKVIVTYNRVPFIYPGGNVRITFDQEITSSSQVGKFLTGDYAQRPILPMGSSILEVKWDEILPMHIKNTLKMDSLQWTAFSKYCMCRTFHL